MNKEEVIEQTQQYVQKVMSGDSSHDWWHVHRVRNMALQLAKQEKADIFIVQLAALLHDIDDWKFNNGDDTIGPKKTREWLQTVNVEESIIFHVCEIIKDLSFKGAAVQTKMRTIEGMIVQDADRLDAIGAIGIARAFAYGGHKKREMYNPNIQPELHDTFEAYMKSNGPTINHFHEKLLLLKDLMNTETAKNIAKERHQFMLKYLEQFNKEW